LTCLGTNIVIVDFNIVLNLVELCVCQLLSILWVNECDLFEEVLAHVFISVLDEYVAGNFFLYINKSIKIGHKFNKLKMVETNSLILKPDILRNSALFINSYVHSKPTA
jgi:hypothetical protein